MATNPFNRGGIGGQKAPSVPSLSTINFDYNSANAQLSKIISRDPMSALVGLVSEFLNNENEDISEIFKVERFQHYLYTLAATAATNGNLAALTLIAPVYEPAYTVKSTTVEKVKNPALADKSATAAPNTEIEALKAEMSGIKALLESLTAPAKDGGK